MIRHYPPPWLKRSDTLSFKSGFTLWWIAWFTLPVPYSQLLPQPISIAAFIVAGPLSLYLLYKGFASWGRIHAGKTGLAWRIGFRRGWLPWEEILEVREAGIFLPRLIITHSDGQVSLPLQSLKSGSRLRIALMQRFPSCTCSGRLQGCRALSNLEYPLFCLLGVPVQAMGGSHPWHNYALYAFVTVLGLVMLNSTLASGDMARRVLADSQGVRWQNRFLGRWRSLSWSEITSAEFDLTAEDGAGLLRLSGETSKALVSGHTSGLLEFLRIVQRTLPSPVRLQIVTESSEIKQALHHP